MIPARSSEPVVGTIYAPDNAPKRPTIDFEMGGIALQDPSQGLQVQTWRAWFDRNEAAVFVEAPNTPPTMIFEQAAITWLSFCFDQNMRWAAVYTLADGQSYLRWYDSALPGYTITPLDVGVVTPYLTLDDKRQSQGAVSDMVLAYIREENVYLRVQRERFGVMHMWAEKIPKDWIIRNFGMSNKLRLQMEIR